MTHADNSMDIVNVVCIFNCGVPEYNLWILRRLLDGSGEVAIVGVFKMLRKLRARKANEFNYRHRSVIFSWFLARHGTIIYCFGSESRQIETIAVCALQC